MDESLDSGGQTLYESLSRTEDSAEMTALITEAARSKDRLDQLNRVLSGDIDCWTRLTELRGGGDALEIRIDSAMTEARQLATVFRQLLADIAKRRGDRGGGEEHDPLPDL